VAALVVEANVFSLASHLYWGIWALIQAKCVHAYPAHQASLPAARGSVRASSRVADCSFVSRPSRYSAIDFDYLDYHALRLAEYRRRRDGVLATVPAGCTATRPTCVGDPLHIPRQRQRDAVEGVGRGFEDVGADPGPKRGRVGCTGQPLHHLGRTGVGHLTRVEEGRACLRLQPRGVM
jgi:hypothetical protein